MKLFYSIIVFVFVTTPATINAQSAQRIDSIFSGLYTIGKFNGNVLIAEKGKIIFQKSYGLANETTGEKLNDHSIFELASVSKQFTAMAVMMLREKGKLSLDDSLGKFIPELSFYKSVTIRNLLNHTGGLPDYMDPVMAAVKPEKKIADNKDIITVLAKNRLPAVFPAGTKFEYSNTGYALLASVIEKTSGMSFEEYLVKNIFQPLGMKSSLVYRRRMAPKKISNYALGYVYSERLKKYILPDEDEATEMVIWLDGIVGDGTVNATAPDLLKWDRALYTGQLVSEKSLEEILSAGRLNSGKKIQYGMGWFIDSSRAYGRVVSHSGGWPGYITFVDRHIDNDKTVIVLQNHSGGENPIGVIRRALYGIKSPQTAEKQEVILSSEKMKEYVGEYELQEDYVMKIFLENDRLKTQLPGQNAFDIFAEGTDKFFLKVVDAQLEFSRDSNGKIFKAVLHQGGRDIEAIKIK